jgi:hypothetical protein
MRAPPGKESSVPAVQEAGRTAVHRVDVTDLVIVRRLSS